MESLSSQNGTQAISPIVVQLSEAAAETTSDDDLKRMKARLDPTYASFKYQLDAILWWVTVCNGRV